MKRWLAKVQAERGTDLSEADASLLYRPSLSWEQHSALCESGDLAAILELLQAEDHPIESEILFVSSFNMLASAGFEDAALKVGMMYFSEFRAPSGRFRPDTVPDSRVLKKLAIIHEQLSEPREAIAVCDCAIRFGVSDGTKGGFVGRKAKLEKNA